MRRIITIMAFIVLMCGQSHAVEGDILSVVVNADGWSLTVTIDEFTTGATYDYGFGTNNAPTASTPFIIVTSEGYDATGALGTIERTVYLTETVRKPFNITTNPLPSNIPDETVVATTDITVKVSLSESIYADDQDGGAGTSGTDPVITIPAGWATDTGDASATSNAYTAQAITTVSSTLDYPMGFGKWDNVAGTMDADRVTGDFVMAMMPVAGFGVACVKLDADGVTSSHNPGTATVTTASTAAYATSGNFRYFYKTTIPLTGFTQAERIALRFRVFPKVGDADSVYDTNNFVDPDIEATCRNKSIITCDKDDSMTLYAIVATAGDSPAGNDGTGVVSATLSTAEANPYLTWSAARFDGANLIYYRAGTYGLVGSNPALIVNTEWLRAMPHPETSKANVTLKIDTNNNYNCTYSSWEDVTIETDGTTGYGLDGQNSRRNRFRGVTFSDVGGKPAKGLHYRSYATYVHNCDGDLATNQWGMSDANIKGSYSLEGCNFGTIGVNAGSVTALNSAVGCNFTFGWYIHFDTRNILPDTDGFIIAYNIWLDAPFGGIPPGHAPLRGVKYAQVIGNAVINNVVEITESPDDTFQWGDALNVAQAWNNVIVQHNTFIGERWNGPYNNTGSTPGIVTSNFQKANIYTTWNLKCDTTSVEDGARIGVWSAMYGSLHKFNVSREQNGPTDTLRNEFIGLSSIEPATGVTFVDDASADGDATGNGDYHLTTGSDGIGLLDEILVPFDIEGTARFIDSATNGGAAGAYEFGTEPAAGGAVDADRTTRNRPRYGAGGRY